MTENIKNQDSQKKKRVAIAMLPLYFLLFIPIFVAIQHRYQNSESPKTQIEKITETGILYSNLVDSVSQEEVKNALLKAGISEENIKNFFENVNDFNKTIDENGLVKNGFAVSKNLSPEYDDALIWEKWMRTHDFEGNNCRITSFWLLKNFVSVWKPEKNNSTNLFLDNSVIDTTKIFDEKEKTIFENLFSVIPTVKSTKVADHVAVVKKDFSNKKIEFLNPKASLISVFFHSAITENEQELFIWHIGVLVPSEDGKLLFIEKLAFQEPYQVIKFENREALNDYLMNKYDVDTTGNTAKPFIFENGDLMEGYDAKIS